jgi:hypothetical protein
MIYPSRVKWNGSVSGHSRETRVNVVQRHRVAASLLTVAPKAERWDENTRTSYTSTKQR